ncbi:isocitrate/isopropylmalate dehydrogenase family protein [Roseomonas chloroacetimidivorans]|uniref:isocitrate/isopropylmalate dehydrogenase family protein n=1 Tax=Roseomonas chloroacetimidivorans TaxID=1766656 RepID=UPI003C777982
MLPGDGIGPEVVDAALKVFEAAAAQVGLSFGTTFHAIGAGLYRDTGEAISAATMEAVGEADAILLGAAGLPNIRKPDGTELAPQIDIREHYDLFASLRPVRLFRGVPPVLARGEVDMLVIREIAEGLFAGRHDPVNNNPDEASDRLTITRKGAERLFEIAFEQARLRKAAGKRGHVTLLDKANVLRSMAFMRGVFDEVASRYPDIGSARLYIDAGCMMFVTDPGRFDVVVSENQFGDITSEIAAGIVGGLGLAPSADISRTHGVFQPSHGSAPDIAGQGVANPVATILSVVMMLEWLAERHTDHRCTDAAGLIQAAVEAVLADGPRTRDLGGQASTEDVTRAIVDAISLRGEAAAA